MSLNGSGYRQYFENLAWVHQLVAVNQVPMQEQHVSPGTSVFGLYAHLLLVLGPCQHTPKVAGVEPDW